MIFGQLFSAVWGVGIAKLFAMSPHSKALPEIEAGLACAVATATMVLTQTVHPPGGASALLAISYPDWSFIPLILLGSTIMTVTALVINNTLRRYPLYWLTPCNTNFLHESGAETSTSTGTSKVEAQGNAGKFPKHTNGPQIQKDDDSPLQVVIQPERVLVPENVFLTEAERDVLESISNRILIS